MTKETMDFLNSLQDLEEVLDSPDFQAKLDNLILPVGDNTKDSLADTGRFPG